MLLAMVICDILRILERDSAKRVLKSTTSGDGLLCDEKDLRPVDVGCSVLSYVLTTDRVLTKDGANVEPVKHQIPRQKYFVGAPNIEVHNC